VKAMPHQRIDAAYQAFADACVGFWLMPGGPLGDGPVDHLPVSDELFAAAFQSIPASIIEGFSRSYSGLQQVVRYLAHEQTPGWRRLTNGYRRHALGFLLVAIRAESNATEGPFHARLAEEIDGDRTATLLQDDLGWLWGELSAWVEDERRQPESEFRSLRPLVLGTYAESMSRIGETIEMAFPNRRDRQCLDPAISRLSTETDPPIAAIITELKRVRDPDGPLRRAIGEFEASPFACTGIASCLRAFLIQRIAAAAGGAGEHMEDEPEVGLVFFRADDGLLVPFVATRSSLAGSATSDFLPEPWQQCRELEPDEAAEDPLSRLGIRPEIARAFGRGSLGLKQINGNWFAALGRVSADAQDAILIRDPPAELRGCTPGYLTGWKQWFRRDNGDVSGLAALRTQAGLLRFGKRVAFTGGVRLAHAGIYLRVPGFGPRAAASDVAWWEARLGADGRSIRIPGNQLDARDLGDGAWQCECFDALGRSLGAASVDFASQPPLRCRFPEIGEHDRVETADPHEDGAHRADGFLRQSHGSAAAGANRSIAWETVSDGGTHYFGRIHCKLIIGFPEGEEAASGAAAEQFEVVRTARDDLLRVLIGRSCDRASPVGWGAFAEDLQLIMNRRSQGGGRWSFRHAGAILRAWEEVGYIDVVNRPWAGLCVVPRPPQWTIVDLGRGAWRAVATGLIGPQQRDLLRETLAAAGAATAAVKTKRSVNPFVPPLLQIDGDGSPEGIERAGREAGLASSEHLSAADANAALHACGCLGALAARIFAGRLDRGGYGADPYQREALAIGDVRLQRSRPRGCESRWFLCDRRQGEGTGFSTASRNWACLLARKRAGEALLLEGSGGILIPLREGLPDCFLPLPAARALTLSCACLPGPVSKDGTRYYGVPLEPANRDHLLRILR